MPLAVCLATSRLISLYCKCLTTFGFPSLHLFCNFSTACYFGYHLCFYFCSRECLGDTQVIILITFNSNKPHQLLQNTTSFSVILVVSREGKSDIKEMKKLSISFVRHKRNCCILPIFCAIISLSQWYHIFCQSQSSWSKREREAWRMDLHATLQAAQPQKEPRQVSFVYVPAINIFCMTRKQEQAKEGNANSNDIPKYHSCSVKQSVNCRKVLWIKSEIAKNTD